MPPPPGKPLHNLNKKNYSPYSKLMNHIFHNIPNKLTQGLKLVYDAKKGRETH